MLNVIQRLGAYNHPEIIAYTDSDPDPVAQPKVSGEQEAN
jgi:hypothetical protein